MNIFAVMRSLSVLVLLLVFSMSLAAFWSIYEYRFVAGSSENLTTVYAFLLAMGSGIAVSLFCLFLTRGKSGRLNSKEALMLVALAWFIGAFFGALPFYYWSNFQGPGVTVEFSNFINCYFEAMSGLTTTGASILTDIPKYPKGLLLWRANIQWLGGLGIVVLFVAVLPWIASGSKKKIYRAEATGISSEPESAKIQASARNLYGIYTFFTVAQLLLMKFFDQSY